MLDLFGSDSSDHCGDAESDDGTVVATASHGGSGLTSTISSTIAQNGTPVDLFELFGSDLESESEEEDDNEAAGVIGGGGERQPTAILSARNGHDLYASPAAHMRALLFASTPRTILKAEYGHSFQWLPCEIDVSCHTTERSVVAPTAHIRTYINNLHPEDHAGLYESIGAIFDRFVPLFDQVLSSLDANFQVEAARVTKASQQRLLPPALLDFQTPRFSLQGKRCQVIIKIAEIILTPDRPTYDGGAWHVEGTDAEKIVATGLYYFGCENITESKLSFRTLVRAPKVESDDRTGVAIAYGLRDQYRLVQNLGSVTAMEDRCVVVFKKLCVPKSVESQIQNMVVGERLSQAQAEARRLQLMSERSPVDDADNDDIAFSLCEH